MFTNTIKLHRRNLQQLFFLYCCALFYVVFLTPNRYAGDSYPLNIVPFLNTIKAFYGQGNEHFWAYYIGYWGNIFGNILLFMPFGFLLKSLHLNQRGLRIVLCAMLVSMCIECTQWFLQIGVCDIDDVILNTTGAAAGIFLFQKLKHKWRALLAADGN